MALSRSAQKRILREDAKRRNAREIEDFIREHAPTKVVDLGVDPYHASRGITGVPSAGNRNYSASDNCWNRGMRGRTIGVANGQPWDTPDAEPTVRIIHADGTEKVIPVPKKSRESRAATRVVRETHVPESARLAPIADYSA